jgi:hypothetical protein
MDICVIQILIKILTFTLKNMKKIFSLVLFSLMLFAISSCKTGSNAENESNAEDSQALASQFSSFVVKFQPEAKTLPATFGGEWLDRQISPAKIDSINCQKFLYNNLVINHELMVGGSDAKEVELDKTKTYYYISKIPLGTDFISVIVSDLEKDATNTYLLNYSKEGKYVSGIVMQAIHLVKDDANGNVVSRESVISDSQMILCQEKLVGRNKFISYDVLTDGKIVKKN